MISLGHYIALPVGVSGGVLAESEDIFPPKHTKDNAEAKERLERRTSYFQVCIQTSALGCLEICC